jgi:hypothetical protein
MIQPCMITASDLARRWGKSTKWVRDNVIRAQAVTVYEVGKRDPLVSLTDVRVIEARSKRPARPSARDALLRLLNGKGPRRARDEDGKFRKAHGHEDQ